MKCILLHSSLQLKANRRFSITRFFSSPTIFLLSRGKAKLLLSQHLCSHTGGAVCLSCHVHNLFAPAMGGDAHYGAAFAT